MAGDRVRAMISLRRALPAIVFVEDAGRLLWGPRWQTEMARALGVSLRLVQMWSARTRAPQPRHMTALSDMLDDRRRDLCGCRDELKRLARRKERLAAVRATAKDGGAGMLRRLLRKAQAGQQKAPPGDGGAGGAAGDP